MQEHPALLEFCVENPWRKLRRSGSTQRQAMPGFIIRAMRGGIGALGKKNGLSRTKLERRSGYRSLWHEEGGGLRSLEDQFALSWRPSRAFSWLAL
jgi:hypothetical protein